MGKCLRSALFYVLIFFCLTCNNAYPYFDNYPPYSFKKGPPEHLEAKSLVDFDKPKYKSRDGKITAKLKEKADSFDFILRDGRLVLAQIKKDEPPLPNSVYQADLDANGLKDFIIFYNYRGNGLAAQRDKVEILLKKKQGVYQKVSYDTFSAGLEDFIDLYRDGKYEVIITDFYGGSKHNYFTYNIYKISDYRLVNADAQSKGFPKFIWFTYNKNDKDTLHLSQEERLSHTEKKNTSIQYEDILGE